MRLGVRVGPISVSGGGRRHRRFSKSDKAALGKVWAVLFGCVLVFEFLAWPYQLADHLMNRSGKGSTGIATVARWASEITWLVLIIGVFLLIMVGVNKRDRATQAQCEAETAAQKAEEQREVEAASRELEKARRRTLPRLSDVPAGLGGRPGERLALAVPVVDLLQPRSAGRGAGQVLAVTDSGRLWITTERIIFASETKTLKWSMGHIIEVKRDGYLGISIPVSNRQMVCGIQAYDFATMIKIWSVTASVLSHARSDRNLYLQAMDEMEAVLSSA